jgi:hypothetical protein
MEENDALIEQNAQLEVEVAAYKDSEGRWDKVDTRN